MFKKNIKQLKGAYSSTSTGCEVRCWVFRSVTMLMLAAGGLLLSAGNCFGQGSDSIITNEGVAFAGRFHKPLFGHSSFSYGGKKHALDPKLYQAYKHDGTWYKSVQVSAATDPVWMEMLERGAIELYQYISFGVAGKSTPRDLPQSKVVWLARKNQGPLLNVNGVMATEKQARDNLHLLLFDQPDLAGEITTVPFSTKLVQGLIAAYNRRALEQQP